MNVDQALALCDHLVDIAKITKELAKDNDLEVKRFMVELTNMLASKAEGVAYLPLSDQ